MLNEKWDFTTYDPNGNSYEIRPPYSIDGPEWCVDKYTAVSNNDETAGGIEFSDFELEVLPFLKAVEKSSTVFDDVYTHKNMTFWRV